MKTPGTVFMIAAGVVYPVSGLYFGYFGTTRVGLILGLSTLILFVFSLFVGLLFGMKPLNQIILFSIPFLLLIIVFLLPSCNYQDRSEAMAGWIKLLVFANLSVGLGSLVANRILRSTKPKID